MSRDYIYSIVSYLIQLFVLALIVPWIVETVEKKKASSTTAGTPSVSTKWPKLQHLQLQLLGHSSPLVLV